MTTTSGNDGTDFKHRQKVAALIKQSVQYKFYLKLLFALHFLIMLPLWAKVGGEIVFNDYALVGPPAFWAKLDLPAAYAWEFIRSLSFIPIIFALISFPKNKFMFLVLLCIFCLKFQPASANPIPNDLEDLKTEVELMKIKFGGDLAVQKAEFGKDLAVMKYEILQIIFLIVVSACVIIGMGFVLFAAVVSRIIHH